MKNVTSNLIGKTLSPLLAILLCSCGQTMSSSHSKPLENTTSSETTATPTGLNDGFIDATAPFYKDAKEDFDFVAQKVADFPYGYYQDKPQIIYMDLAFALNYVNDGRGVEAEINGGIETIVCENGASFIIDAAKNTILAHNLDYANNFSNRFGARLNLIDDEAASKWTATEGSSFHDGEDVVFDLNAYSLDIVSSDGKIYIPFSIANRLSFNLTYYSPVAWNGEAFYLLNMISGAFGLDGASNSYGQKYYSGPNSKIAKEEYFADWNYHALLFDLDHFYGFNDERFVPFEDYLDRHHPDIVSKLRSTNEDEYCDGMEYLLETIIGDGHTNAGQATSSYGGGVTSYHGYSSERMDAMFDKGMASYRNRIASGHHEQIDSLRYSGSTAFLPFDSFAHSGIDFYQGGIQQASIHNQDTFALFYTAFEELKSHPEIKNVIFDITINGGGDTNALVGMLGFLKKDIRIDMYDPLTKGHSELHYQVDTNLDGVFDEEDSFEGEYNFYVLTSGFSFSCGNLFPDACKQNGCAKIIGQQSGGGACAVDFVATPDGKPYRISGNFREGQFGDPKSHRDDGVPVDIEIEPEQFYDDAYLDALLN